MSTQIATWVLFFSYFIAMWWLFIGMFWEKQNERQNAKGQEPARQHERSLKEGAGPGMLLSIHILGRITLWEAVQVVIAIAFMNLILAFVVVVPNALVVFVLGFFGAGKNAIQFLAFLECYLVSVLLALFAYNAHYSLGDQLPTSKN
jgi:hypothetical protein